MRLRYLCAGYFKWGTTSGSELQAGTTGRKPPQSFATRPESRSRGVTITRVRSDRRVLPPTTTDANPHSGQERGTHGLLAGAPTGLG